MAAVPVEARRPGLRLDSGNRMFLLCSNNEREVPMSDNQPSPMPTYRGQCHCGAVRFTATTDLASPGACNCSRCRRLGWVMQSLPAANFRLESGEDHLALYQFSTRTIDHLFCATCGIESFARGTDGQGHALVMINTSCLEDAPPIDPAVVKHWDGANW
jgi:hypothetical protein